LKSKKGANFEFAPFLLYFCYKIILLSHSMSDRLLHSKIQMLQSEALKSDLLLYIEFLLAKQSGEIQSRKRVPVFGSAKGTFKMTDDFDEPLDDFKEYMPE
jgi:hypothetical protein